MSTCKNVVLIGIHPVEPNYCGTTEKFFYNAKTELALFYTFSSKFLKIINTLVKCETICQKLPSNVIGYIEALCSHLYLPFFRFLRPQGHILKVKPENEMSLIQGVFAVLFIFSIWETDVEAARSYKCRPGSVFIENSTLDSCFAVLDPGEGPMNATYARHKCMTLYAQSDLVYVMQKVSSTFLDVTFLIL